MIRPVAFSPDGSITALHEGSGHGGAVAFADVRFGRDPAGAVAADYIEITCPVCAAVSVHPIGGGGDPSAVQKLFARTVLRRAAVLGIPAGQRTWPAIRARIKARVEAMDGIGRFRLEAMTSEDDVVEE